MEANEFFKKKFEELNYNVKEEDNSLTIFTKTETTIRSCIKQLIVYKNNMYLVGLRQSENFKLDYVSQEFVSELLSDLSFIWSEFFKQTESNFILFKWTGESEEFNVLDGLLKGETISNMDINTVEMIMGFKYNYFSFKSGFCLTRGKHNPISSIKMFSNNVLDFFRQKKEKDPTILTDCSFTHCQIDYHIFGFSEKLFLSITEDDKYCIQIKDKLNSFDNQQLALNWLEEHVAKKAEAAELKSLFHPQLFHFSNLVKSRIGYLDESMIKQIAKQLCSVHQSYKNIEIYSVREKESLEKPIIPNFKQTQHFSLFYVLDHYVLIDSTKVSSPAFFLLHASEEKDIFYWLKNIIKDEWEFKCMLKEIRNVLDEIKIKNIFNH